MANFRRGDLVVLRGCTKGTVYKVVKRSVINPNEWIIISGGCCEFVRGSVLEVCDMDDVMICRSCGSKNTYKCKITDVIVCKDCDYQD